ncbi:hypothetical protein V2G26_016281 [Clonostachys chloroleuca]
MFLVYLKCLFHREIWYIRSLPQFHSPTICSQCRVNICIFSPVQTPSIQPPRFLLSPSFPPKQTHVVPESPYHHTAAFWLLPTATTDNKLKHSAGPLNHTTGLN